MRKVVRLVEIGLIACVVVLAVSCGGPGEIPVNIEIEQIGWIFENIDTDFFASSPSSSAFATFWLYLGPDDLPESSIASVEIGAQGTVWYYEPGDFSYDPSSQSIELLRNWSSSRANWIPITDWTFSVNLIDGTTVSTARSFPPPASTTVDPSVYAAYTEDYVGSKSGMKPLIPRAQAGLTSSTSTTINLWFSVNDDRVYNAWVWVFDSSGTYLGYTECAVDWATGAVNTGLVPDGVFNTDGTTNNVVLNASNTTMVGFAPFSAIDYVIVVLSDGSQHMTEYGFDYRSISEWIAVP